MDKICNFSQNLKDLCEENNINIKNLASELNISASLMYKYVNNIVLPTIKNAIKIANYFNCSLDYLFGINENDKDLTNIKHEFTPNFYTRYELLLKENQTTHYQLCKKLNLTSSSLTHWKNGEIPYADTLIKLALYFDTSIDYLIGRSDNQ